MVEVELFLIQKYEDRFLQWSLQLTKWLPKCLHYGKGWYYCYSRKSQIQVAFKKDAQFTKCITKNDGIAKDDAYIWRLNSITVMHSLIEYISGFSYITGTSWFYSKDEATNFSNDVEKTDAFTFFMYKAKLLGNTEAYGVNRILRNAAIAVPLKYRSTFRKFLKVPLINCKFEVNFKWGKHCVLATNGSDNDDVKSNNIISIIKGTKEYVCSFNLSAKTVKNYQNFLANDSKDHCTKMSIK